MNRAFKITYLLPSGAYPKAALLFESKKTRRSVILRDLAVTAEHQAEDLARATPGFIAFGALSPGQWVYIINQPKDYGEKTNG